MPADFFLDTNVLVYTFDAGSPVKQRRARELVRLGLRSGRGAISWQVVGEFLNVALHKFAAPMKPPEAVQYLDEVLWPMCRVLPTEAVYREAISIQVETGFRFFDALIVAAAVASGSETLYSEDLQDARKIRGVLIRNPFA